MLISRTQRELDEIRQQIAKLQGQLDAIIDRIASLPNPPRASWHRKTLDWRDTAEVPTKILPITRKRDTAPRIARVTLAMSGQEQFVNAYDAQGNRLPEFCGRFREVGLQVLERAGNLEWEMVAESA